MHGSSGTGGRPTLVAYTRAGLALCARALAAAGATRDSVMHNAYGYGLFTGGLGFHYGAVELGAAVVPSSGGMTPQQVTLIRDLSPDILCCTPSYAIRLGEALAEAGVRPGRGSCSRRACSAPGEAGPPEWGLSAEGELETRHRDELGVSVGCGCCRRAPFRGVKSARRSGWCAGTTAARRCRAWSKLSGLE